MGEKMLAREALLRALKNERILRKMPFWEAGFVPGPEPLVRLSAEKVLVDRKKRLLYISLEDLEEVIRTQILPE